MASYITKFNLFSEICQTKSQFVDVKLIQNHSVHSFIHSFIHSLVRSFVRSFVYSVRSFFHSFPFFLVVY